MLASKIKGRGTSFPGMTHEVRLDSSRAFSSLVRRSPSVSFTVANGHENYDVQNATHHAPGLTPLTTAPTTGAIIRRPHDQADRLDLKSGRSRQLPPGLAQTDHTAP